MVTRLATLRIDVDLTDYVLRSEEREEESVNSEMATVHWRPPSAY